jgi:hypothetical protein
MPDCRSRLECSSYNSQITGGIENAVLSAYRYISQLIVTLKITGTTILLELTAHQTPKFHWMASAILLPFLHWTLTPQSLELDISAIF